MNKWYGSIGFSVTSEVAPGVWEEELVEHMYYGDIIRNSRRLQSSDQLNDSITLSNEISVIADPFATNNFHSIRYVEFMGTNWKVTNVEVQYPRLILTIGGVYNGDTTPT